MEARMALKEWATVLLAIERGEQLVLIRKGGLIEPGSGFEWIAKQFVFYPTFEHQAVKFLREPYQGSFEEATARRAPEGHVRVDLYGEMVDSVASTDPTLIKRLESFHIYNEAFLEQRLKWQPQQPLVIGIVRAFRLPAPQTIPLADRYVGCKSWVELDAPLSLDGAIPVVDDATFQTRLQTIRSIFVNVTTSIVSPSPRREK
ncbi:MAG: DUF1802 family protein [Candidatus Omnitrophica bacterium]|nr:DUF1802 family protein [Candidatus Omnitrophota bacterium]